MGMYAMNMNFQEFLQDNRVLFDGGTGTLLQRAGLPLGELSERWNISHAEVVEQIHLDYFNAGSNVVCTNTFGANCLKFSLDELESILRAAIENAKRAREKATGSAPKFVALDIGPTGKLLKPFGEFAFEKAVEVFAQTVKLGVERGVDLIYIETMGDAYETKAAVLAAKENSTLPVLVSCAYGEDGRLMTGATPAAMVALLEGLRVDGIGVNCSVGPKQMRPVVEELLARSSLPILVKPNAGLPTVDGGYDVTEEEFASLVAEFAQMGARCLGGCCGTTPAYIQRVKERVAHIPLQPIVKKEHTCVSSYAHAVDFSRPVLIGERINPTGKKRFKQALKEGDVGYILGEGIAQQEKGAHILDVNVGAPEIDEERELPRYIEELQAVVNLPLQIDTANVAAMEKAMRVYNGKPLVNSVNGKKESMDGIFPLAQKYGGVVIALTLDERGIPNSVEGRVEIAKRIIAEGAKYGISPTEILVDPLAMAVSAESGAARITLQTVRALTEMGIKTSLGVSNVSFGLPSREVINAAFLSQALAFGLSAAIVNPSSEEMLRSYYAHLALSGQDEHCKKYIDFATQRNPAPLESRRVDTQITLQEAIVRGLKGEAAEQAKALLQGKAPLQIIEGEIVPALDTVGQAYEEKKAFLPQLLVSAEAAKSAFEVLKSYMVEKGNVQESKGKIVLATVRGDIHDIGKNIVGSLLSNYGFTVLDLGRDVPTEEIVAAAKEEGVFLVGLSALMTTTLPSMAETTARLKAELPMVKVLVGGAVVTEEYAKKIGADGYAKDGMASVRFAEGCKR